MKKLMTALLTLLLLAVACGALAEEAQGSRVLIAYFAVAENSAVDAVSSASVYTDENGSRGFTRVLADVIADATGGDLFSITTDVDYPAQINELIEYDSWEKDENIRPALTSELPDLSDYDTVFIGYPIWWYGLPPIMLNFFETYDFTGKTIIPFCTHLGSRFSDTIETIKEMEPGATVIENGFTVQFDEAPAAEADERAWLAELGY